MARLAIVAALEREVGPLLKDWRVAEKEYGGRRFRFYEKGGAIVVCGGMGAEAARRAAEAAIVLSSPSVIYSVGFAGALDSKLKIGDVVEPGRVVNASDGSSTNVDRGQGVLVSFMTVASPAQKAKLRDSFSAQAVDMEAAAVSLAAEARGIKFAVLKAISDELDFALPEMDRFVDADGGFSEFRFAAYAVLRPWLWSRVAKLACDSNRASHALCHALRNLINNDGGISVEEDSGRTLQTVPRR